MYEIPNIDEVAGIYLATSRGHRWGKIEPPDYILMCHSANVPVITYQSEGVPSRGIRSLGVMGEGPGNLRFVALSHVVVGPKK